MSETSGSLLREYNYEFSSANIFWDRLWAQCWEFRGERSVPILAQLGGVWEALRVDK